MKTRFRGALTLALALTATLDARTQTLNLDKALSLPAEDLARSCLADVILEQFLILADSGATIQTANGPITGENVDDQRRALETRLGLCTSAIQVRGQAELPQHLALHTSTSQCEQAGSGWADLISGDLVEEIEVFQEEFPGILSTTIILDGRTRNVEQPLVVVENSLAMMDYSNTSYLWLGVVTGDRIELRPDIGVLTSWPEWATPPKKKDLQKCRIELAAGVPG